MLAISDVASLGGRRALSVHRVDLGRRIERLASGARINGAKDDPAGWAASRRMEAEVRGRQQVIRNLNDGMSMLRTAEAGLDEMMQAVQRMRELAVQAAQDTLTATDRSALEAELSQLVEQVDQISAQTSFNGVRLLEVTPGSTPSSSLGALEQSIVENLRARWLAQSEALITEHYGLTGDGVELAISLEVDSGLPGANVVGGVAGLVRATIAIGPGTGLGTNLEFEIDAADAENMGAEYDAVVAHEIVHAVQYRTLNMRDTINGGDGASTGTWFTEGLAELIPGADARVAGTLTRHTDAELADRVTELLNGGAWGGGGAHGFSTADDYSAGYVAVRYLHDRISDAGGQGIRDVLAYMSQNPGSGLDEALQNIAAGGYAGGMTDFATDFSGGAGVAFIQGMDLANADTGAIGGADADGGPVRTAESVIPDTYDHRAQPLQGFEVVWPDGADPLETSFESTEANPVDLSTPRIDSGVLGLEEVRLSGGEAIGRLDRAIDTLSEAQAEVGGRMARLEAAISAEASAAERAAAGLARVRDADFASETRALAKARVLEQVATAMLAQGTGRRQVLRTLLGL
jgi:flagellin